MGQSEKRTTMASIDGLETDRQRLKEREREKEKEKERGREDGRVTERERYSVQGTGGGALSSTVTIVGIGGA